MPPSLSARKKMAHRKWSDDLPYLIRHYGRTPARRIARSLGRTVHAVHAAAHKYAVTRTPHDPPLALLALIRERNAEGYRDAAIAREWNRAHWGCRVTRRAVANYRRMLGLEPHRDDQTRRVER